MRALPQLYAASLLPGTFAEYGGHLLLAFALIARTSKSARIRHAARRMGIARARHWRQQWPVTSATLDADRVMQAAIASYAMALLGCADEGVRAHLAREITRWHTRYLL
jgi:hypothetical protein